MNLVLCCPLCKKTLSELFCSDCSELYRDDNGINRLIKNIDGINLKTIDAYKLYSKFYSIIALLTYWIIWRGNLTKHVAFFRELASNNTILDIATGEGSLTHMALLGDRNRKAKHIVAVDLSSSMLEKAQKKMDDNVTLIQADVEHLPFANQSFETIACFGGLNSFPSGTLALTELKRVLSLDGRIRGSFLLMPEKEWKKKLVRKWIEQGYQTGELTLERFSNWVRKAGLRESIIKRYGDVVLFELKH